MPRSKFEVRLTIDAERDLEEIVEFIEDNDSAARANEAFSALGNVIRRLDSTPRRGRIVPELRDVGVSDYRELRWKPYRIIYFFPSNDAVTVVAVLDGRRELEDLLARRLLRDHR